MERSRPGPGGGIGSAVVARLTARGAQVFATDAHLAPAHGLESDSQRIILIEADLAADSGVETQVARDHPLLRKAPGAIL